MEMLLSLWKHLEVMLGNAANNNKKKRSHQNDVHIRDTRYEQ